MTFKFQPLLSERMCSYCREAKHESCDYVVEVSEINAGAGDADDFVSITPWCTCYLARESWHWHLFETARNAEGIEEIMADMEKNQPATAWYHPTWEACFRPSEKTISALIDKHGFTTANCVPSSAAFTVVGNLIADVVFAKTPHELSQWREVELDLDHVKEVVHLSVNPENYTDGLQPAPSVILYDVARLIDRLRLEGEITMSMRAVVERGE